MVINYRGLVEDFQNHPTDAKRCLTEALQEGSIRANELDFGRLFVECFGWEEFQACRSQRDRLVTTDVYEAAGGTTTAAFQNISGQIIYSLTLQGYQSEEFVFTKVIPERTSPFSFEKIAEVTEIGPGTDAEWITAEGEEFKTAGPGENWINLPETVKRGKIVALTREAVFFDRTGQLQEKAGKIGFWYGYNREMRAIDCVIDENDGAKSAANGGHRYHWRDSSIATYGDNSGTHNWDNLAASNALVDWTNLNTMDQLFNNITDPNTGAVIMLDADTLIVPKRLEQTAGYIVRATSLHVVTPGYATSGVPTLHDGPNPYGGKNILTSRLFESRQATKTSWYYGRPKEAFVYLVNLPFETSQAPANSDDEFSRDIVAKYRCSERAAYGTMDPRKMTKATA